MISANPNQQYENKMSIWLMEWFCDTIFSSVKRSNTVEKKIDCIGLYTLQILLTHFATW